MHQLTEKKQINSMILLMTITYMISYITRINYGAVISEMVSAEGMAKSVLSTAVTGSFITYGAGQVISGFFGDRYQPKTLVFCGLVATTLMNALIPFCKTPLQMLVVWCINGLAQAFMWPPLVRLMANLFSESDYKRACVIVSWGSSLGTILIYLLSPAIIAVAGWRSVFTVSAICGIVMAFVWMRFCPHITDEKHIINMPQSSQNGEKDRTWTPLIFCIMVAIILQGSLRDGVTTWMPSYISETYNMSSIISILTGIVLPLFSILCFQITQWLYRRKFTNPLICSGVIFSFGLISALLLIITTGNNVIASVAFSALLTGAMHGINLLLLCMVPPFFKKGNNVSFVSGVLNSCTYIGSAVSTYGIALISERFGWSATLILWSAIALFGTLVCFVSAPAWKKKFQ